MCIWLCVWVHFHLSSFLLLSPSHDFTHGNTVWVSVPNLTEFPMCVVPSGLLSGCFITKSGRSATQRAACICQCAHSSCISFSSQSWERLKQCGRWNTTTTTRGITASGETASTALSTSASQMTHAHSCGSTRRFLCKISRNSLKSSVCTAKEKRDVALLTNTVPWQNYLLCPVVEHMFVLLYHLHRESKWLNCVIFNIAFRFPSLTRIRKYKTL